VYFEGYFVDAGEPGRNDRARIIFTYNPDFADDPATDPDPFILDNGVIQKGNIQIHISSGFEETLMKGPIRNP
jgi:hypothetical protein